MRPEGKAQGFTAARVIVLSLEKNTNNYNLSFFHDQSGQAGDMQ